MEKQDLYQKYAEDELVMNVYIDYQQRYKEVPRESDKIIISALRNNPSIINGGKILDVGCSSGNLLKHLIRIIPQASLTGLDIHAPSIENAKLDPDLEDVKFIVGDMESLPSGSFYDVVIFNAITGCLDDEQFTKAITRAAAMTKKIIIFDWINPFDQELEIVERTKKFPSGFPWAVRSETTFRKLLTSVGFNSVEFSPFEIGIDLPKPEDKSSVVSYTVPLPSGSRMSFRGCFCQPWSHLFAEKL